MFGRTKRLEPRKGEYVRFCTQRGCDFHLWQVGDNKEHNKTWERVLRFHLAEKHRKYPTAA